MNFAMWQAEFTCSKFIPASISGARQWILIVDLFFPTHPPLFMTLEEARQVEILLHSIRSAEGNISCLERYLNGGKNPNYFTPGGRNDIGEVKISTYSCGDFEFRMDEESIQKAAREMLQKEAHSLSRLISQLNSIKVQNLPTI